MDDQQTASSISQSRSIEEMAEFWDAHDTTEFHDQTHEATLEFDLRTRRHYVALDPDLRDQLRKLAQARGISLESLANLWLQERVLATES